MREPLFERGNRRALRLKPALRACVAPDAQQRIACAANRLRDGIPRALDSACAARDLVRDLRLRSSERLLRNPRGLGFLALLFERLDLLVGRFGQVSV